MADLEVLDHHRAGRLERQLLGLALSEPEHLAAVVAEVKPDDLASQHHAELLRLLRKRLVTGRPFDLTDLIQQVVAEGDGRFGGVAYVAELSDEVPSSRMALPPVIAAVRDQATRRRLREVALQVGQLAQGREVEMPGGVRTRADDGQHAVDIASRLLAQVGTADERHEWRAGAARQKALERKDAGHVDMAPLPTGLDALDLALCGGPRRGDLVIVGGRPGWGKTALALGMAAEMSMSDLAVGYLPMEMRAEQLDNRLVSRLAGVPLHAVVADSMTTEQAEDVLSAHDLLDSSRFWVNDRPSLSVPQLVTICQRWKASGGLDVVFVDYLQRMDHGQASRHDLAVGATAVALKNLARTLDVVVVALCQLSRGQDSRRQRSGSDWVDAMGLPRASDIRDSGQIEQEADCIVFPLRPVEDIAERFETDPSEARLVIAKNRHGPTGVHPLSWDGERATFQPAEVLPW